MDFKVEEVFFDNSNDIKLNFHMKDEPDTEEIIFGEDFFAEETVEIKKNWKDSAKEGGAKEDSAKECNQCAKKFVLLTVHKKIVHKGKEPKRCYLCGQIFCRTKDIKNHLYCHNSLKVMCYICHKIFQGSKKLISHLQKHKELHIYACKSCPMTFATEDQCMNHTECHERFPEFQCFFCYKIFTSRLSVKSHLQKKHPCRYQCPICKKILGTARSLRFHMWRHKDLLPFECADCTMKFPTKSRLRYHLTHVHKDAKFKCHICSKLFRYRFNFETHMTFHKPAQKFKCNSCSKSFLYKVSLKDHFVDTSCFICRKTFDCRTLRFRHQDKAHKRFFCKFCKEYLRSEKSLKYHQTVYHLGHLKTELFECDLCKHITNTKHNLQRHRRRSHSSNTTPLLS